MGYKIPLRDLEATFVTVADNGWHLEESRELLPTHQGLWFTCPCHYAQNGMSDIGVHKILCWFRNRGVPDSLSPSPGRWTPVGTGIDDLTFDYGVPPVAKSVAADCHFFIKNGMASEDDD
jgi:hypothetical protein